MERFAKIVNSIQPLTILPNASSQMFEGVLNKRLEPYLAPLAPCQVNIMELFTKIVNEFHLSVVNSFREKVPSQIFARVLITSLITQQTFTCSKSTTKTLEKSVKYIQSYWRCSCVFVVNVEHISRLFLVFLLLTLNK